MARIVDNIIALRIIYLLVQPFESTDAFKLGLIDAQGNTIKKAETSAEKNSTSMLHRLVWNLKKVIALAPGGSSRLGSLTAAYLLVREAYEQKMDTPLSTKYFTENFDRVHNLDFEEKEFVVDAFEVIAEDAVAANVTGAPVSTNEPVIKKTRKFAQFKVSDQTFDKFKDGKAQIRRWSSYLNLEDATEKKIYDFAKANPRSVMVLKDSKGRMKGVRQSKRGSEDWANVKRNPKQIAESVFFKEIEIDTI